MRSFIHFVSLLIFFLAACKENNQSSSAVSAPFVCPNNYVKIQANANRSLNEFCVMKFEAKAEKILPDTSTEIDAEGCSAGCATTGWASIYHAQSNPTGYYPVSAAEGKPWRLITLADAKAACKNLGSKYDLISNDEWMAVGEEIIYQDENWSGGSIDNGIPKRSNCGIVAAGVSYNGADPEGGDSRNTLASHKVSSDEDIFDLSGNLWEWVEWEKDSDLAYPGDCGTGGWVLNGAVNCPAWDLNSYRPYVSNSEISLGSINNMGRITSTSGVATRAVARGAGFGNSTFSGIFAMWGSADRSIGYSSVGFRCVLRK